MKQWLTNNLMVWISAVVAVGFYVINVDKEVSRAIFMDVGQGDAILLQSGGYNILIDGGPDNTVLYKLDLYLLPFDRKIDYLFLSHPHADHLNGLLEVVARYDVSKVIIYPVCYRSLAYRLFLDSLNDEQIVGIDEIDNSLIGEFNIDITWPVVSSMGEPNRCESSETGLIKSYDGNVNNDSIVMSIETTSKKLLFMGDAEREVESTLVKSGLLDEVDILKAGHHCSKTSNTQAFLEKVSPDIVICSVGVDNKYGHPSPEVIERFGKLKIESRVTYTEGDIIIEL